MKKIISVLLAIGLMTAVLPTGFTSFSDVENSEAIDVVTGIGIMEGYADGTFLPENNLTRAEFAEIAAGIYKYGEEDNAVAEWKQNFFEGIFEETELIPPEVMNQEESELFWDVSAQSDTYDAIKLVYEKGIMVGNGDGSFNPDGNVTVIQALKVILSMMGYGYQATLYGGYPNGYAAVASEIGVSDGLGDITGYATREDIAVILYNALDVPLMQLSIKGGDEVIYESVEEDTFLTKLLNMDYDKGRMTNNGYTTLSGLSPYSDEWIVINNVRYKVNESTNYARDYLGREVKAYYSLDEDEDGIVFVMPTGKDEVVSFNISEFEGYSDSKISYLLKDASREKQISVKAAPYMIKNGEALASFDSTAFDYNYGTVTVVTPVNESKADLIILKSYYNFNIDYVDADNEIIYSSSSLLGTEIDLNSEEKNVRIFDAQGAETSMKSLANGTVTSICMSDDIIEIYISDKEESGFYVKGVGEDDFGEYTLTGNNASYTLSKDYIEKGTGIMPQIGSTYNLKLDMFGNIVKLDQVAAEYTIAFMNSAKMVDDEDTAELKLRIRHYDFTTQKLITSYVADKLKLTDTEGNKKNYSMDKSSEAVCALLEDYISTTENNANVRCGGIFRYKMNDENEISEIELAGIQENSTDDSSRLVEIPVSKTSANATMYNGRDLIGGKIIVNNNTKILKCNYKTDNFDTDEGYSVSTKSDFKEGGKYEIRAYSTTKNSPIAEIIVYTSDPTKSISTDTPHTCGIVTDIYQGLNSDDEVTTYIVMNSAEYEVEEGVLNEGNIQSMQGATSYKDANGKTHNFKVEKGDLIRYGFGGDGAINQVQLLYDADSDYSDGLNIGGVTYNGFSKRGNLAGCIDGYNSAVYQFSNPFSAVSGDTGNSFASDPYAWSYYNGNMRVMLGTVLRTGNGYLVTTTRNLQENPGTVSDDGDGVYATNTWNASSCTIVTVGNKNISVKTDSVSNLRSYTALGSSCDRILITSRIGTVYNIIVYRYDD